MAYSISNIVSGAIYTVGAIIGLLFAIIAYLSRGWASHVSECLSTLFERTREEGEKRKEAFEELERRREHKWEELEKLCRDCQKGISWLKGKVNGMVQK